MTSFIIALFLKVNVIRNTKDFLNKNLISIFKKQIVKKVFSIKEKKDMIQYQKIKLY